MSFLSYQETRPWAKAIKQAVTVRKMPPWYADPHTGEFRNDRTLPASDIAQISAWADAGAPEGNPADAPKPLSFVEGWQIGRPDLILEMPSEFSIPSQGTVEYQYVVIPTGLKEDRWVQAAEARPGNRAVVHHIIAFIREPGSKWLKDAVPGVPFVPAKGGHERGVMADDNLTGFAPGMPAEILPPGQARLLKAGSDIVLQMHYTASGKAQSDRSRIGVVFAKAPPRKRVLTAAVSNQKFVIPPGDSNYRVDAELTLYSPSTLIGMLPHMHLRGKAFSYRVTYPDGRREDLLNVPKYDFNWQLWYLPAEVKVLPAGTKVACTAFFDNSANNPANPDPQAEVRYGEQSWEEMMFGFFNIAVDVNINKMDLYRPKRETSQAVPAKSGD
ncbi:MAG: thiol-disulfide isomerase [Bryobacterales bacterium]|nr:thiol-disulfide isomerase [Bryobacterales bacterium]